MKHISYFMVSLFALLTVGFVQAHAVESTDKYIVVLKSEPVKMFSSSMRSTVAITKDGVIKEMLAQIAEQKQLPKATRVYSAALEGGVFELTSTEAKKLAQHPIVKYVEKDQIAKISAVQSGVDWGLDRIDQQSLPLNSSYFYPTNGYQVHAYIIDTGILTSHQQFQGRADSSIDIVDGDYNATDCNGHGTHVAGTVGGSTYGVAKNVRLHAVRVLDCQGSGSFSDVIAGIDWVTRNHQYPAVANMSLGGGQSRALDDAVIASIRSGVTYSLAAGNESEPACNTSPSRVREAIVVGSTTEQDAASSFSNYGSCVSVWAPGSNITSSWIGSNYAVNTISGTSMAAPHVAGVAALYLSQYPSASPSQVKSALLSSSVSGRLAGVGSGSPNLLINTQFLGTSSY